MEPERLTRKDLVVGMRVRYHRIWSTGEVAKRDGMEGTVVGLSLACEDAHVLFDDGFKASLMPRALSRSNDPEFD